MKNIVLLENFQFGQTPEAEKKEVKEIFNRTRRRRRLMSVELRRDDTPPKHLANEPITVLCLAGSGIFRAGRDLEGGLRLPAGTLILL